MPHAQLELSDDLVSWAARAGYTVTPQDISGAAVFWSDPGGEIRFYIRVAADGCFVVSSAERALDEQIELVGFAMPAVERYLFAVFATGVRSRLALPRLVRSGTSRSLVAGYRLSEVDEDGYRCLYGPLGRVAKARGEITGVATLTELSHLVSAPSAVVQTSFEDRHGRPLFEVR